MTDSFNLTHSIIGCAMNVHQILGPGLLESVYEECLCYELKNKDLQIARQVAVPVVYKEIKMEYGYRLDILVEDSIILELKSVETLSPVHTAQILTYMKLMVY